MTETSHLHWQWCAHIFAYKLITMAIGRVYRDELSENTGPAFGLREPDQKWPTTFDVCGCLLDSNHIGGSGITTYTVQDYKLASDAVRHCSSIQPQIGIALGSGFGDIAYELQDAVEISYSDIPGFPVSTAPGHKGRLHLGTWGGCRVAVMQGRVHAYEGYSPQTVGFPIRVIHTLGVQTVLLVNAAGGINKAFNVADFMFIHDHISLASLAGQDPMRGPNIDSIGSRFTPLNNAYDRELLRLANDVAKENQITAHQGGYGYVVGPSFETASEVRLLSRLGIDAVGMSTVPEVITARHARMKVFAVSAISNLSIEDIDSTVETTEDEVWQSVEAIIPNLTVLLREILRRTSPT